jgi:hypothetical protein
MKEARGVAFDASSIKDAPDNQPSKVVTRMVLANKRSSTMSFSRNSRRDSQSLGALRVSLWDG